MNDIILIGAYPNTEIKELQVMDCINSLKSADKEVMLVTHCPISIQLQDMVDYFIYDYNNFLITDWEEFSTWYWYKSDSLSFSYIINVGDHQIANMTNHRNGLSFAKALGKDLVYYFEGDSRFDDSDLYRFNYIKDFLKQHNKKTYFEIERNIKYPNTFNCKLELFVGDPNFLLRTIDWVNNSKDYFKNVRERSISDTDGETLTTALECYYYDYLSSKNSFTRKPPVEFSILENSTSFNYESNLFPNLQMNLNNQWTDDIELGNNIFFYKEKNYKPAIISTNKTKEGQKYEVSVESNGKEILYETYSLLPNEIFFKEIPIGNGSYEVKFKNNGRIFLEKNYSKEDIVTLDNNNHLPWWSDDER
jgi:hypothetical protein